MDVPDREGHTPLRYTLRPPYATDEDVRYLISRGADVNARVWLSGTCTTMLELAYYIGGFLYVRRLLKANAEADDSLGLL